jgi:predicted amidohydrolase YtcJ
MATRLTTLLVIVIVGATFIAGLIVGAQRDDANGPVDLIIVNGKVYPGGGAALQEAIAVRGNQILRVGSNREVKRLRRAQTVVLDAHGATVLPGLNDSYVQFTVGALALDDLNLSPVTTIEDIEQEVRSYADRKPARPWLLGRNGDADLLGSADVRARAILDAAVEDRPVLITSNDGNVAWANSKALELAGITHKTRNPVHGIVMKDRRTGEPTGVLKDEAIALVERVMPQPTRAEKIAALEAAISEAHKFGITSVQSVSTTDEELDLLNVIRHDDGLKIRVSASIAMPAAITEAAIVALNKLREQFPDDPALKVGGATLMCPCEAADVERAVVLLDKHHWPVMVRTVNGGDVHAASTAFEHAARINTVNFERRHRLDETLLSDESPRILSGSNWPEASLDPLDAMHETAIDAGDLRTTIDAYTTHAAYASYDDQRKGTLKRGMLADIVILSNDILASPRAALDGARVTVTIFDGKIVYQRTAASSND